MAGAKKGGQKVPQAVKTLALKTARAVGAEGKPVPPTPPTPRKPLAREKVIAALKRLHPMD